MDDLTSNTVELLSGEGARAALKSAAILVVGLILARMVGSVVERVVGRYGDPRASVLMRRIVFYVLAGLVALSALAELGVDLSVLMGAAGILTVAIGFASQTSASNIISGLFLLGERPFVVGDVIRIGDTLGVVTDINLLSVKLATFDNLLVRIPNESLLKSEITNLTHYPIRRIDIAFHVPYGADLARVREVLVGVADKNPLCLEEPKPLFLIKGFEDSGIALQFSPWAARESYLEARTGVQLEIVLAFAEAGIVTPFPQRTVTFGPVGPGGPSLALRPEEGAAGPGGDAEAKEARDV